MSRQQKLLRKRLGLDIAPGIDVGMDKLFDDEDLIVSAQEGKGKSLTKQKSFEVGKPQTHNISSFHKMHSSFEEAMKRIVVGG